MKRTLSPGLALLVALSGCQRPGPSPKPSKPRLEIIARGDENSNGGHTLQVVVRAVEEQEFIEDSYSDIAALVSRPDASVLKILTVFPGETTRAVLTLAELPASFGVYGLFNDTREGQWKLLVESRPGTALDVGKDVHVIEIAASETSLRDLLDPEQRSSLASASW